MRAANRAHASTAVSNSQAQALLSRLLIAALATLALLVVWRPALLHAQGNSAAAQESNSRTHVVKAGETLWGLAARYYGDGHQWQNLARQNGIPVSNEPPLRVGMRLTVPARPVVRGAKAAEVAAAPADSTVPKVALAKAGEGTMPVSDATGNRAPAGSLAAQTSGKGNAGAGQSGRAVAAPRPAAATASQQPPAANAAQPPDTSKANLQPTVGTVMGDRGFRRIGLTDPDAAMNSRKPSEVVTVFHRDLPDAAEAERRTRAVLRPNTPAPRTAEYLSAPFVMEARSLEKLGRIAARVGSPLASDEYPQRAIKTDQVELEAAPAQSFSVGDRLVAFGPPSKLDTDQALVLPTGVLEVVSAETGKPALAVVRRQSGRIEAGQQLLPASNVSAPWVKSVRLEAPDVMTTVKWLDPQEAQPTLQSFLVVAAGSAKGLAPGDELAVYRRIAKGTTQTVAALVRVVRVERDYATTVITKQYQTDIAVGMTAWRYAKAP
jgi:LysM repeat protein